MKVTKWDPFLLKANATQEPNTVADDFKFRIRMWNWSAFVNLTGSPIAPFDGELTATVVGGRAIYGVTNTNSNKLTPWIYEYMVSTAQDASNNNLTDLLAQWQIIEVTEVDAENLDTTLRNIDTKLDSARTLIKNNYYWS